MMSLPRRAMCGCLMVVVVLNVSANLGLSAQKKQPAPVAVVFSCTSLNNIKEDIRYIFQSAGFPEKAMTLEAFAILSTAGHGAAGIDPARPFGVAWQSGGEEMVPFGFIPISSEKRFLSLIRVFFPKLKKNGPGRYLDAEDKIFEFQIKDDWAFVFTHTADSPKFPSPKRFIGPGVGNYDVSVSVNLDQFDEKTKDAFAGGLANYNSRKRIQLTDVPKEISNHLLELTFRETINDSKQVIFGLRISEKERTCVLEMVAKPKAGASAAVYRDKQEHASRRVSRILQRPGTRKFAFNYLLHDGTRTALREFFSRVAFESLVERETRKASSQGNGEKQTATECRQFVDRLLSQPVLEVAVIKPEAEKKQAGAAGWLYAVHLPNAKQQEQWLRATMKKSQSGLKQKIDVDFAKSKNATIHRIRHSLQTKAGILQASATESSIYFVFTTDAFIVATGSRGLETLREAVDADVYQPSQEIPPSQVFAEVGAEYTVGPIVDFFSESKEVQALVRKNFKKDSRIRFQIETSKKQFTARLETQEAYHRLLAMAYGWSFDSILGEIGPGSGFGFGMNSLVMLGYLIGGPPTIEPEFTTATGIDLQRDAEKVLVLCTAPKEMKFDYDDVDQDIAKRVRQQLNTHSISAVFPDKILNAKIQNQVDKKPADVGASLGADYVMSIHVETFSLYEKGVTNLYRCRFEAKLSVTRVADGKVVFEKDIIDAYPIRQPKPTSEISYNRFKTLSLARISDVIGRCFFEYHASDDIEHGVLE